MATPSPYRKDPPHRTRREAVLRAAVLARAYEDEEPSSQQQVSIQQHRSTPEQQSGKRSVLSPPPMLTPTSAALSPPLAAADTSNSPSSSSGKKGIPHIYHDYGRVPDQPGYIRKKTGGVTQPFPEKLYEMLESENLSGGDVVDWLPHGRAFIVRRPREFTDGIMPKYFRQTKLTSFQRQLNLYGFRRLTQGVDAGAYYHELFLRGRPALCVRMKRQKVKGTGHKQPADVKTEPNFYSFSPVALEEVTVGQEAPGEQEVEASSQQDPQETAPLIHQHAHLTAPMSPGIGSVRGAADLLRGIASGERKRGLPPLAFVGLPPSAAMAPRIDSSPAIKLAPLPRTSCGTKLKGAPVQAFQPTQGAYFLPQQLYTVDASVPAQHGADPGQDEVSDEASHSSSTTPHPAGPTEISPEDSSGQRQTTASSRYLSS